MCNEYLTGPALHRAIADAQEAGEGPEVFGTREIDEYYTTGFHSWDGIIRLDSLGYHIIRKPRMQHLTTQDGKRYEWPEPLQKRPSRGDIYFHPVIQYGYPDVWRAVWADTPPDNKRFDNGFCFDAGDTAYQCVRALIAASGGTVD